MKASQRKIHETLQRKVPVIKVNETFIKIAMKDFMKASRKIYEILETRFSNVSP